MESGAWYPMTPGPVGPLGPPGRPVVDGVVHLGGVDPTGPWDHPPDPWVHPDHTNGQCSMSHLHDTSAFDALVTTAVGALHQLKQLHIRDLMQVSLESAMTATPSKCRTADSDPFFSTPAKPVSTIVASDLSLQVSGESASRLQAFHQISADSAPGQPPHKLSHVVSAESAHGQPASRGQGHRQISCESVKPELDLAAADSVTLSQNPGRGHHRQISRESGDSGTSFKSGASCISSPIASESQELDEAAAAVEEKVRKLFLRVSPQGEALSPERIYTIMLMVLGESKTPDFVDVCITIQLLAQAAQGKTKLHKPSRSPTSTKSKDKTRHRRSSIASLHTTFSLAVGAAVQHFFYIHRKEDHVAVDYRTFKYIMASGPLHGEEQNKFKSTARFLRDALVKHGADVLIAKHARLMLPTGVMVKKPRFLQALEALSGIVILVNALTIGLSAEIPWSGWDAIELAFTCFFSAEILVKTLANGWRNQICGPDRGWNWFDMVLVAMAITDVVLQQAALNTVSNFHNFTLGRILRLARLTRLMRLLRLLKLKIFKELLLMVRGVFAGLRTLFWAIVLLMFLIYSCAILLMTTVGDAKMEIGHEDVKVVLFNSLLWSMFNVFRCFMSDGVLIDGTPLVGRLEAEYGAAFVIPYAFCTLFIVFGIFNLIAAIFVENVIESAKTKRELTDEQDQIRVALLLRSLLLKFATYRDKDETRKFASYLGNKDGTRTETSMSLQDVGFNAIKSIRTQSFSKTFGSMRRRSNNEDDFFHLSEAQNVYELDGMITRSMFEQAIKDPYILALLDDLEIPLSDRNELFDVVDADGSGAIDYSEMIVGVMKMRSVAADRADAVATNLYLRAVQTHLQEMGALQERRHEDIMLLLRTCS